MQKSPLRKHILHLFLIIATGTLVYCNTLHVPFYFDDVRNIVKNPLIKNLNYFINPPDPGGRDIYADFQIRSAAYLTFALNYAIHGLRVEGYHIVNILIHIINAVLVYGLVILSFKTPLLCRSAIKDLSHLIALFSALIFAPHPVQTQAVTYIVQRLASLATMFYLFSLLFYIKWRLQQKSEERQKFSFLKSCLLYLASFSSAVLAMKSKEIAFTLPLIIILYEFMFFQGNVRKRVIFIVPILLTMLIIPLSFLAHEKSLEGVEDIAKALSGRGEVSRADYLMTQFRVIVTYFRLLVFPTNLNLDYDYPVYHSFSDPRVFLSFLLLLGVSGAGLYLYYRSRYSDYALRFTAFGIFWVIITLSVESSIIPLTLIFEHRLYLPSVGFFISLLTIIFTVAELSYGKEAIKTTVFLLSLIVFLLAGAGYYRNEVWNDPPAFWKGVIRMSPGKGRPRSALGDAYMAEGRFNEASHEYQAALGLDPHDSVSQANLILIYVQQGRFEEVFKLYEEGLKAGADNAEFHNYVSLAYFRTGRPAEAERELRISIKMNPYYPDAHFNLGRLLMQQRRYVEAEQELRAALNRNPEHAEARNSLGVLYTLLERYGEAEKELESALRLNPDYPDIRNNLAGIYARSGRHEDAIKEYQEALRLNPEDVGAHNNLARIYAQTGRYDDAIDELRSVLRLRPDFEDARYNLKTVLDLRAGHK